MKFYQPCKLLIVALLCSNFLIVWAGRRYALVDGEIVEVEMFGNEMDFLEQMGLKTEQDALKEPDSLLIHNILQQREKLNNWSWFKNTKKYDIGSYALIHLVPSSVFSIGVNGKVFERFYNSVKWVFMKHSGENERLFTKVFTGRKWDYMPLSKDDIGVATALTYIVQKTTKGTISKIHQGVILANDKGKLFQREATSAGVLLWVDISIPNDKVYSAGLVCKQAIVYFVSELGLLYERSLKDNQWVTLGTMNGHFLSVVLDACNFQKDSIFLMSMQGNIIQFYQGKWVFHGQPPQGNVLFQKPGFGFSYEDDKKSTSSLFLSSNLGLFEYQYNKITNEYKWNLHELPTSHHVLTAPYGFSQGEEDPKIFIISSTRQLFCLVKEEEEWFWKSYESPLDHRLANVRPLAYKSPSDEELNIVTISESGQFVVLHMLFTGNWEWGIYETPESGNAPYCSTEVNSEDHCVKGYVKD